jgi:hypothetical protein
MAKQLLEINKFMNGTVTTPDATDTPEQSASHSLNLDCVNKDGALQGAPINTSVTIAEGDGTVSPAAAPDIDKSVVLKKVSKSTGIVEEDVVYWEDNNNKLHLIKNVHAADTTTRLDHDDYPTFADNDGIGLTTTPLKDVAMETHNKEVHIGFGNANLPMWVGYTNHKSLGRGSGILIAEEAEVKYPSSVPHLYKTVRSGNDFYMYGIKLGGTRIWKINGTTGAFVAKSDAGTFSNLQSICTDGTDIFVLDRIGTGKIFKVGTDDLSQKDVTYTLPSTYAGPTGSNYTDIEYTSTNTKLWVAASYDGGTPVTQSSTAKLLWNFTAGSSATVTLDPKMPKLTGYANVTTPGSWVTVLDMDGTITAADFSVMSDNQVYIAETFKRSLVKHDSDDAAIYWLARYPNYSSVSDDITTFTPLWLNRTTADISGSNVLDRVNSVTEKRTLCLHRIKNDHTDVTDFVPLHHVYHPNNADNRNSVFSTCDINSAMMEPQTDRLFISADDKIQRLASAVTTSWTTPETSGNYNIYTLGGVYETTYSVTPSGQDPRTDVKVMLGYQPDADGSGTYSGNTSVLALLRASGTAGIDTIANDFAAGATQTLLKDHSVISLTNSQGDGSNNGDLQAGYGYWYKFSMLFDGYQETPLCTESFAFDQADSGNSLATANRLSRIVINDKDQIPSRASSIKIYRAEATSSSATTPVSLFRLVDTISLASGWTESGVTFYKDISDKGIKGASYEAASGLPESIEATLPKYGVSAQLNNQHYIGNCYHPGYIEDATSYVFASKVGKFDVFDWVVDFVKLPTVPTALIGFNGRIFAFDDTNTYKIVGSPGLYIEDIFEGVGCLNDDAIVATDFGLFFADNQNIYQHNGKSAEPIGEPIVRGDSLYSWQNRDKTYHTRAMYDASRRSVYFTFRGAAGTSVANNYYAWAWNIPRKRWDMLSFADTETTTQPKGFYTLNDSSINVSTGSGVVNFLGHASTKRQWEWVSKDLTMGNDTQEKNVRSILVPTRIKANYTVNSAKPAAGDQLGAAKVRGTYRMDIESADRKTTNLKVRLDSNAAGDECGAVGVLFKTKRSPR